MGDYEIFEDMPYIDKGKSALIRKAHTRGKAVLRRYDTVRRLAQSPDCTGLEGGLDQPGEPILWNGKIIVSCFDAVVNDIVRNTAHELPATLAEIDLNG